MELKHLELAELCISGHNMRCGGKAPDIANILPSVRTRGIIVPLIVRPVPADGLQDDPADAGDGKGKYNCGEPNGGQPFYEIVAGRRRYHAALAVLEEAGKFDALPCAVLEAGDDAAALEASLIENVARLDPDEVTRWESFVRLVKEGRTPEDIALTFGLTELQVKRTLALGNLLPRVRNLYRRGEIDAATVRHLTLVSKARQKEWLALYDSEYAHAPCGHNLKNWLLGGASIPTSVAIFDVASYDEEIVSDLFGEERYFADADSFWAAQNAAVEALATGYREAGWKEVIILQPGQYFSGWEHERRPKAKGGKVFIAINHRGEVTTHEGYVSLKEARSEARGEAADRPKRPELSAPLLNYVDLHRHAAVRERIAAKPALALRLVLAHAIHGSMLWQVRVEPQRAHSDGIAESVENCSSDAAFDERRRAVLATLGFDAETPTVTRGYDGELGISGLLLRLLDLPDEAILQDLAIVMAETLEAGSALIETLGRHLAIDMADAFAPDDAMLDLVKDRELLDAMLAEVAGEEVAAANAKATGKVKRKIIADCLKGEGGRAKVERFVPRFMAFPPSAYTGRGGVATVSRAASIATLFEQRCEAGDAADALPDAPSGEPQQLPEAA